MPPSVPNPAPGREIRSAPRSARSQSGEVPVPGPRRPAELPPAHAALICVAMPGLAISPEHGQLTGQGLEGYYRAGRRLLSRCRLRVAGREPLAVQARLVSSDRARFVATLRPAGEGGPDPVVMVERTRDADGTERITLRSAASRPLKLPVEVSLATDLAELGAVASGRPGAELPASVHDSGMRWSSPAGHAVVTAEPPPDDALASAGLLRWDLELPAGGTRTIELRVRQDGVAPRVPSARVRAIRSPGPSPPATTPACPPC